MATSPLVKRVLLRLQNAEDREPDPQLQENYRLAWLTVLHASRGHREPHVAAFYAVFGLHPNKVWAAIVERREALLGRSYESFFAEPLFADQIFADHPPKKPPQSVRPGDEQFRQLAAGEQRRPLDKKQTARVESPRRSAPLFETPDMASTQVAYPNPSAPNRAKSQSPGFQIAAMIDGSALPRGPRHTLAAMHRAADYPYGRDIQLWPALKGITIEAQIAERTARYHLRKLEQLKVIEQVYPANARIRPDHFRHTATYRLHVERLNQRPNYTHYKNNLPLTMPKRPQSDKSEAPSPTPALKPAPVAEPVRTEKPRKLTSRECSKLIGFVKFFKQGRTHVGEGVGRRLLPSDPEYLAPMNQEEAIVAACKELGVPIESAIETLKLAGWKVGNA